MRMPDSSLLYLAACLVPVACHGGGGARTGDCGANVLPGDVVITEIFANAAGEDRGNEWFELYNATGAPVDLAGLTLHASKGDGSAAKDHELTTLEIAAGDWVVLGGVLDQDGVRPEFIDYGYGADLGDLPNTSGRLAVMCGETAIDEVPYEEVTEAASRGFDGSRTPDASGNDDITLWCDATTTFTDGVLATPGAANDACAGVGVPTTCLQDGTARDVVAPAIGDLVISEFHADPAVVEDDAGEWFEVYVGATVDINGLAFGRTLEDGPQGSVASADCISIEAGTYLLFARGDDPATNGGLPAPVGLFDFALGNSAGSLLLFYGDDVLDEISWTGTDPGAANSLDPDFVTAEGNDDPSHFCAATTPYGDGDFGTPAAANDTQCEIAPPAGQCWDGTQFIDVMSPGPGDVVITEFHANPAAVDDAAGEWFELTANAPFHLNGLELGRGGEVEDTVEVADCILVGVGDAVVLARGDDPAQNGGLPEVAATFAFSLGNSDGTLNVGFGGTVLDDIAWPSSSSGAATQLDPSFTDPGDNDDPAHWCDAIDPYGDGDLGSPGATNPACGTVNPGTCLDGGTRRAAVAPGVGDVVITELMPDPSAVSDASGEWFEVLVTADVDLNGLELGTEVGMADETLPVGGDCIAVAAGTRVVFARSTDGASNGGLPAVQAAFGFGLANGGGSLVVGYGGAPLDVVTWSAASAGASVSLDPDAENPTDNDDQGNFCAGTTPYGDGDLGTPGAVGLDCVGNTDGMCDDGGNLRAIVPPAPGELVISEVMANPAAVADADGEWFEVAILGDFDLNGLQLSTTDDGVTVNLQQTVDNSACLAVTADTRVLFVRNATMAENGGLPDGGFVFAFGLVNSTDGLALGVDGTVLDAVTWATTPTGASRSLDEAALDPVANDNDANWCASSTAYGAGDLGTPLATNDGC